MRRRSPGLAGAPAGRVAPGRDAALSDRLRLDRVELRLIDGAAVEQLLGLLDLGRRVVRSSDRADVIVRLPLGYLRPLRAALRHLLSLRAEIDEHAYERQHDGEHRPSRLSPAR